MDIQNVGGTPGGTRTFLLGMIMAIAGGALVVVQGQLADAFGLQASFFLTVACELYVLWYAVWGARATDARLSS